MIPTGEGHMNPLTFAEPPVLAALIAAFSALAIAIFQFFTQRRQSTSIEELKAQLSQQAAKETKYLEAYLNLVVEGRQQQSQAYGSILQGIQLLRDQIRNFLGQPESYDPEVICSEVSEQAQAIQTIYSANQLQLDEAGRHLGHEAKNLARDVAKIFENYRQLNQSHSHRTEQFPNMRDIEKRMSEVQALMRRRALEANSALVRSLESGNGKSFQ
jgi:hypothetical protein